LGAQCFARLLDKTVFGKADIYSGYTALTETEAWKNKNEIPNQIKALRQNRNVQEVFTSAVKHLAMANGWNDSLQK